MKYFAQCILCKEDGSRRLTYVILLLLSVTYKNIYKFMENKVYAALSEVQEEIEELIRKGYLTRDDVQSLMVQINQEKLRTLNGGSAVDADINELKMKYKKAYTMILSRKGPIVF